MRKGFWAATIALALAPGLARADVLTVPETETAAPMALPVKGTSMSDVEQKFGEPVARQPTVGGDSPKQPPITRWDYSGFSVIFEHDKVVDTVVPGTPPRIHHKDQLIGAAPEMAPPEPAPVEAPPAEAAPMGAAPMEETLPPPEPDAYMPELGDPPPPEQAEPAPADPAAETEPPQ